MQARGPLMIEHRLIERMLSSVEAALAQIETTQRVDAWWVESVVDFMRIYADRTHHGKEEDILFAELASRELAADDRRAMDDLVCDHIAGRELVGTLAEANQQNRDGEPEALTLIVERLRRLCEFYPPHITKEDKLFFPAARTYFSDEEDQALLARFREFDRAVIHAQYQAVVEAIERG